MCGIYILCILVIIIVATFTPWWFFPLVILVSFISQVLFRKK